MARESPWPSWQSSACDRRFSHLILLNRLVQEVHDRSLEVKSRQQCAAYAETGIRNSSHIRSSGTRGGSDTGIENSYQGACSRGNQACLHPSHSRGSFHVYEAFSHTLETLLTNLYSVCLPGQRTPTALAIKHAGWGPPHIEHSWLKINSPVQGLCKLQAEIQEYATKII